MESLANKYRPHTFEDVVGQEHAISILQNQLETGNFKQAYLFCGGAGTGKTTIARIFANRIDGELIEIDAASNNGVESVRDIREKVKYKPMQKAYKVYILDETHMLSTGAFNALLKTLEEPPPHAIFIMCTTDPQKIPATILSRVQRYDFKRIPHEKVVGQLTHIVECENNGQDNGEPPYMQEQVYQVDPDVFDYIAKLADGGMRDAISLLDTCLGYKPHLQMEDIFEILGTAPISDYLNILYHMYNQDPQSLITKLEDIHMSGKDMKQFINGLAGFVIDLRKLLLFRSMEFVKVPSIYEEQMKQIINHLNHNSAVGVNEELNKLFKELTGLQAKIKYVQSPKVLVQGELLSLCQL